MKGPRSRVPFSVPVKRTLAFIAGLSIVALAFEFYSLAEPDTVAPISWAFWWLRENAGWLPAVLAGAGGAFYSHFFWYRKPGDFWHPITRNAALVAGAASLGGIAAVQGWRLLAFMGAFMGAAVLAHRYWYRLEDFGEHLAQFHDEE